MMMTLPGLSKPMGKVFACMAMLLFFGSSPTAAMETPEEALAGIQRAVDGNDPVLLEKYVDMRGIAARGVDLFVRDFKARPPGGEGDPLLEMLAMSLESGDSGQGTQPVKLLLAEEARKFVLRNVASGNFSGRPVNRTDLPDGGLFSALFTDVSTARKELRSVRVQRNREEAKATARLYDFGNERSYPLLLRLKAQPEGFWKVTEVENMAELIRMIRQEPEE